MSKKANSKSLHGKTKSPKHPVFFKREIFSAKENFLKKTLAVEM